MFEWLKRKKRPGTAIDPFTEATYGSNARTTANVAEAVALATNDLLLGRFDKNEIMALATALNSGPVPYSTHDLAASTALGLLRKVPKEARKELFDLQLKARFTVGAWAAEGKVIIPLAQAFEQTLYKDYHPDAF